MPFFLRIFLNRFFSFFFCFFFGRDETPDPRPPPHEVSSPKWANPTCQFFVNPSFLCRWLSWTCFFNVHCSWHNQANPPHLFQKCLERTEKHVGGQDDEILAGFLQLVVYLFLRINECFCHGWCSLERNEINVSQITFHILLSFISMDTSTPFFAFWHHHQTYSRPARTATMRCWNWMRKRFSFSCKVQKPHLQQNIFIVQELEKTLEVCSVQILIF